MRFAYIDSQGNEVPIPSVDALALRIELGAIGPETQLYDAQADHWAPANTHEIFHTLSRAKGDEGFVAPPPVAPPPLMGEEPAVEEPAPEEPAEAAPADAAPVEEEAPEDDMPSFDLAAGMELEPAEAEVETVADTPSDEVGMADLDLSLADSPVEAPAVEEPAADAMDFGAALGDPDDLAPEAPEEDEAAAFDFGDMGSLELEGGPMEEEAEAAAPDGGGMLMEEPLSDVDSDSMDFGGGMGGGLELETPMSEFSAEEPPAWMEQDGPGGDDADEGSMDFSAPTADAPAEEDEEAPQQEARKEPPHREKREPRSRPSPPKRRTSKKPLIMGVVAVAVLGGGGYFGMQFMANRPDRPESEEEAPALPEVTIPQIPAELLPTMRDLAEAALGDMVRELEGMQAGLDLPVEPRNDWLSGSYLGQASQYGDLEQYWLGIEAFVDRVRDIDTQVFHDAYVARVEAAGIAADTAALLIERADSGFLATREERFAAYNEMDDLINAALNLHDFLVTNEQDITYESAAGGVSRDPVLEAVPATEALGREMWEMVDQITEALDALGTLDRVTTPRLFAVLFDRIRRAGIE